MPKEHREYAAWNGERFLSWAGKIGTHTAAVVQLFLSRNQIEQQGYKSCIALLKLSDTHSALRLEQACNRTSGSRALSFTERPSLKSIQIILKSGQDNLPPTEPKPNHQDIAGRAFTRGKAYYQQKEEN